ncbi:hypothetical protein Prum_054840 [Phytohabitans rumicis]|uniref:Uncharacterized protein n=2 Tax=Phytohabitans rumicis TaxID=1076125 RepID=A0A6V8L3K3_9ACTN|nr:hypothetical protein Prum_054840 [Phytohabitans rumicis]
MQGGLDQASLEAVRQALGLSRRGRLTDQEDMEFGYAYLNGEGEPHVVVTLWRYADDRWGVTLDADPRVDVSTPDVERWAAQAEAAATEAGLTVVERDTDPAARREVRRLFVLLRGQIDESRLNELRTALGLEPAGRLDDPSAWELGARRLDGGAVLRLVRLDGTWGVAIDATPDAAIAPSDLAHWAERATAAATVAGLAPAAPVLR